MGMTQWNEWGLGPIAAEPSHCGILTRTVKLSGEAAWWSRIASTGWVTPKQGTRSRRCAFVRTEYTDIRGSVQLASMVATFQTFAGGGPEEAN